MPMTEKLPYPLCDLRVPVKQVVCNKGDVLKKQFSKVEHFYFLLEGVVHFYQSIPMQEKEILAGKSHSMFGPIGLDAFIPPYRNETTARVASESARLLKIETKALLAFLADHQEISIAFFKFLNEQSHRFIEDTSELFVNTSVTLQVLKENQPSNGHALEDLKEKDELIHCLIDSPFFEVFDEEKLSFLAGQIKRRKYLANEIIIGQGDKRDGIFMLESGEVQYSRSNFSLESNQHLNVAFRALSTPGYLISTSTLLGIESAMTSFVTQEAVILQIPGKAIEEMCVANSEFALLYQQRILWLINNQLRAVRIRLIATQFDQEILVAKTLINSNNTRISIDSPLHQVPVLLNDKETIPYAIDLLHQVELTGTGSEKNLASLCLDNLPKTQKESDFYTALKDIYSSVAESEEGMTSDEIRQECVEASERAFSIPSIHIEGMENLPKKGGCVFIYNHLLNDPYYTLPNQFQITLDSHFISSLIYEQYGAQAQRVVRIGKSDEFGHENYYSKLGFIEVKTKDSDHVPETEEQKIVRHEWFFSTFRKTLSEGTSIIVSPEGASFTSQQSPGHFRSGMFKVIQKLEKEPYIVPIVMANFDKRISEYKYACRVNKPFKLSEKMAEYGVVDLKKFLRKFEGEYREEIRKLIDDTASENSAQTLFEDEVKTLKQRLSTLKENDTTVFYGSSTIRLWESLEKDLEERNAINLGFGGSSYKLCLHYFDFLFSDFKPSSFVLYGGDNDLSRGQTPEEIAYTLEKLVAKIRRLNPGADISIISIKPSPIREYLLAKIKKTNSLLKSLVDKYPNAKWIEVFDYMLSQDGIPRSELFSDDMLHLNELGYDVWRTEVCGQLRGSKQLVVSK